jgi:hypothetical protein
VAVVEVAVGPAGAGLTVSAAVAVSLVRPACPLVAVVTRSWAGLAGVAATAGCRTVALGTGLGPGLGLAAEYGLVGAVSLTLGGDPVLVTTAAAGLTRAAVLAVIPGPCLAGAGLREVARLASPLVTAVRLLSPVCLTRGLRSTIDIEQT